MTKGKARILAYLFFVIASVCLFVNQYLLMILMGVPSLALIWMYVHKDERDKGFIAQAKQERDAASEAETPTLSKKKPGLFVPPPLHEHNKETMQ